MLETWLNFVSVMICIKENTVTHAQGYLLILIVTHVIWLFSSEIKQKLLRKRIYLIWSSNPKQYTYYTEI